MKLIRYKEIKGKILLETGLHIGAGQDATQIGGLDNPVIRLPRDAMPYIPGSSLKGKMRSLLELHLGKVDPSGGVHRYTAEACNEPRCPICLVFGSAANEGAPEAEAPGRRRRVRPRLVFGSAANEGAPLGPGRLVVRDCMIDLENPENQRIRREITGLPFSEEKTEIAINRITSKVDVGLRKTERVPAGVRFDLDLTLRVFDEDDKSIEDIVLLGLALIERDALGGSGSRGYGKVKFEDLRDGDGKPIELPKV